MRKAECEPMKSQRKNVVCAHKKTYMACCKKYKPYILKYVPCIFDVFKYVFSSNLQMSVFEGIFNPEKPRF